MSLNTRVFDAEVHIDIDDSNGTTSLNDHTLIVNSEIFRLMQSKTPSSSNDTGLVGEWCWDSSYFYICIASNTWNRVAHSTW